MDTRKYLQKTFTCLHCNKQFVGRANKNRKYCNRECSHKGQWGDGKRTAKTVAVRVREWEHRVRLKAFNAYGGALCQCCGTTVPEFLTIDHINGDGSRHRKQVAMASGKIHLWLNRNGFPPGFRVLCFNCNVGAYRNGGECRCQSMKDTPALG